MNHAQETLKDHTYTLLCSSEKPFVQVWRCQQPGTMMESFDLLLTADRLTLSGDIDAVVLEIGQRHGGFEYLAPMDEAFYQRKLGCATRPTELDFEALRRATYHHVYMQLLGDMPNPAEAEGADLNAILPEDYSEEAWQSLLKLLERECLQMPKPQWGDSISRPRPPHSRFKAINAWESLPEVEEYLHSITELKGHGVPALLGYQYIAGLGDRINDELCYEYESGAFDKLTGSLVHRVQLMQEAVRQIAAQQAST